MKFGLFNLMTQRGRDTTPRRIVEDTVSMVRLAEEIGFDIAWFAEHHFSNYSLCPSPLMMAAHCAGLTQRIRLGTAVVVLPLYHPLRMVQEIGLLDVLSQGRAVIGIGSGYQKYEFDRFARSLDERTAVTMEVWDIMERALTDGEVEYKGEYFDVPRTPIAMRPLQRPMPELFVTGMAPEVLRRALSGGYPPFITGGWRGLAAMAQLREIIAAEARAVDVDPATMPLAIQQYVHVTDSRAEALDMAERARFTGRIVACMRAGDPLLDGPFIQAPAMPEEPPLETFRDTTVIGGPEHCAARIVEEIRVLKPTHYSCFMQIGGLEGPRALRSLERFGAEVIPLIEQELGPLDTVNEAAPRPLLTAAD